MLNSAAAICERPALCTQANTYVLRPSDSCDIKMSSAVSDIEGMNHRDRNVAAIAPAICTAMKAGTSAGRMPAKVFEKHLASVTAGFANDVDEVNQYAPVM